MKTMSVKKMSYFIDIAYRVAQESHDVDTKVGSVFVDSDTLSIKSTGYNGFVRNANDGTLPNNRPDKYEYMIHAEENAICNAARGGVNTSNCIVINTLSPCPHCTRLCFQAGIKQIIFKEKHATLDKTLKMKDIKTNLKVFKTINGDFYVLDLLNGEE